MIKLINNKAISGCFLFCRNISVTGMLIVVLILCCLEPTAHAQNTTETPYERWGWIESWKGTFSASLPSTEVTVEYDPDFTDQIDRCTYTKEWKVEGQCILYLDEDCVPSNSLVDVYTWSGTGSFTVSYKEVQKWEILNPDEFDNCISWTETEEGGVPYSAYEGDEYTYSLDLSFEDYDPECYNSYRFSTPNISFYTKVTNHSCSGDVYDSSGGWWGRFANYDDPAGYYCVALPESGLTLTGSVETIHETVGYGALYVDVPFNWTLEPNSKPDGTLKITKLEQSPSSKAGAGTDFVFHKGKLVFTAEAKVTPVKKVDQIKWDVPAIGNESDRTIRVTNNLSTGVSKLVVRYNKLPESNDDFGSKKLTANISDMEMTDSKDFRVFFEQNGKDHPDSGSGWEKSANWYYYWKQGGASAPVPKLDQFEFVKKTEGGGYNPTTKKLEVDPTSIAPIPSRNETVTGCPHDPGLYTYTFSRDSVKGMQAVAAIVAHELTHKKLFDARNDDNDRDEDGVPVGDESDVPPNTCSKMKKEYPNHPSCSNTYNLSAELFFGGKCDDFKGILNWKKRQDCNNADKQLKEVGDNEIKAIHAEKSRVCDPSKDWAWPGSQSGQ